VEASKPDAAPPPPLSPIEREWAERNKARPDPDPEPVDQTEEAEADRILDGVILKHKGEQSREVAAVDEANIAKANAEAALKLMNSKHAVIDNYGGKTVIMSVDRSSLDPTRTQTSFGHKNDFLLRYSNRYVSTAYFDREEQEWKTGRKPLGPWWSRMSNIGVMNQAQT
jgi:hypothetical protein